MKTSEWSIELDPRRIATAEPPSAEEVLIDRLLGASPEALRDRVHRLEAQVEESHMVINPETEAATEYKGYQALIERAVDVFGDELIASRWLSTPSNDLNGAVPLHVAQKLRYEPAKVQKVFEPIFMQIEHGIYS